MKRSGTVEPFSREKIISGVGKACQGRPVSEYDLALLAHQVEDEIRARGVTQVESDEVGRAILKPLRELDEVAYLRFASVYSSFESLADFEEAIAELRIARGDIAAEGRRAAAPVAAASVAAAPVAGESEQSSDANSARAGTKKPTRSRAAGKAQGAQTVPLPIETTVGDKKRATAKRKRQDRREKGEQGTLIG